jgi:hypothetical protein
MWDWLEKRIFSEKFLLIVWAHYLIFIRIYYSNKEFVINCKFDFLYLVYIEIGKPWNLNALIDTKFIEYFTYRTGADKIIERNEWELFNHCSLNTVS